MRQQEDAGLRGLAKPPARCLGQANMGEFFMRRIIAMLVSLAMAVTPVFAQSGGHSGGGGSHKEALSKARDHINGDKQLSAEDKARHLERVDLAEREMTAIDNATSRVLEIAAREGVSLTAAQKAEIEAELREHLAAIGSSHARLAALERELISEMEASNELTPEQKAEFKATLQKLHQKKITLEEARVSLTSGGFVMEGVLIIILVVVGAGFGGGGGRLPPG
jgi:hypothetical protein